MRLTRSVLLAFAMLALATGRSTAIDTNPHIDASGANMQPAYPASAYATREAGTTALSARVTPEGTVDRVRLLKTSGFNDIDSAAIAAVMGWKFVPAEHDSQPVSGEAVVAITFQPPPVAGGVSEQTTVAIKEPTDFLPPSIDLEAGHDHAEQFVRPIPCPNGQAGTTFTVKYQKGGAAGHSSMALRVSSDHETAEVVMGVSGTEEFFEFAAGSTGNEDVALTFTKQAKSGTEVPVSIAWDARGNVEGRVALETQHFKFAVPPTHLVLGAFSIAGRFTDSRLYCIPGK